MFAKLIFDYLHFPTRFLTCCSYEVKSSLSYDESNTGKGKSVAVSVIVAMEVTMACKKLIILIINFPLHCLAGYYVY